MIKILVASTVPETSGIGGVTIHTQRLLECEDLKSDKFSLSLFDYKKHRISDYLRQLSGYDAVHIHISNPKARFLYVCLAKAKGKKVILTVHGNLGRHNTLNNFFDYTAVKISDIPVLINKKSYLKALKHNSRSQFLTAFIPPQKPEFLPDGIHAVLDEAAQRYGKIYATNAYRRSYDDKGNEIYGISFLVNVFSKIRDTCLIISDPSGEYMASEDMRDLPDNVKIVNERHSFFELLKRIDGMIRATSTDGDAISIKEALYLGKKVLATDCVDRPEGVRLFGYNDGRSLIAALDDAEDDYGANTHQAIDTAIPHLKEIYECF